MWWSISPEAIVALNDYKIPDMVRLGEKLAEYWFPGKFTSFNDYTNKNRTHWSKGAKTKKDETGGIYYDLIGALPIRDYPVRIEFYWHCADERTDQDNIAFAKKFILDGMVEAHILEGDSWKYIRGGFSDSFKVDKKDVGVIVVVRKFEDDQV
jgi:hypothetical protein